MSAAPFYSTADLQPALLVLAANADAKVKDVAASHRLLHMTAESTYDAIWDWLKRYNGGRRSFSISLVSRALVAERDAAQPPTQPAPRKPAPAPAAAPAVAKPRAEAVPFDDGTSPWAKHPQGPRTMKKHRPELEALIAAKDFDTVPKSSLRGFLGHWLGTVAPAPERVARFLKWVDSRPAKAAAPVKVKAQRVPRAFEAGRVKARAPRTVHPCGAVSVPLADFFKGPAGLGLFKFEIEVRVVPLATN